MRNVKTNSTTNSQQFSIYRKKQQLPQYRCRWLFLAIASTRTSNNYIIIINLRVAIGFVTPTLAFFDQCSHMFKTI